MSKQKFVVFLIAIIGMIATFLPWYEIGGLGMIMGYQTVGWRLSCLPLFFFLACGKRQSRICPWGYYTSDHFFRCLPLSWFCGR